MTQVRGKCPKCRTAFNVEVEPGAFFLCPGCGARLKSRGETPRPPQITERLEAAVAAAAVAAAETDGTRPVSGEGETPGGAQAAPPPEVAPTPPAPPAAVETPPPASADASTGEAPTPAETPRPDPSGAPDASHPVAPTPGSSLEELMYSLYVVQKEILETLQSRLGPRGGQEIRQAGDQVVSCANYNSPGQVVIAGHSAAVERVCTAAKSAGARRALPLPVSVPPVCV
jgi:hypothetical protein